MVKLKSVGRYVMEERTLGKGNFAVVELASHTITKSKVAVKIIDRRKIKEEYMQQNMYREARVMSRLRHPNIVRLYETIKSNHLYFLVTEYVAGGDLLSYVRNQRDGYLSESKSRGFVRQLVSALHHLHERGVVHRDLKMENIILDEKRKNVKLIDFGLSNVYYANQLLKTHCGSPEYAAPELFIAGREYGPEVDIWSFGVIVYAMVTGKLPFTAPHTENRRQRLLQQINAGLGTIHEKDMQHLSEDCRNLLRRCIEPSIARIHLLDIMTHHWITVGGKETFYTFQQPPKDPYMKAEIINKMTSLLNIDRATLEAQVHENHCDEVSAVFNLMLDDLLRERGKWEGDHTRRRPGTRQSKSSSPQNKPSGRETPGSRSQTPTAAIEPPLRLRTPTIVGMVRPSSRNERGSPLQSADFELSVVEYEGKGTPDRPKSATVPPSSLYTRPMGNATTVNIILARQKHFPRPATSPGNISSHRTKQNKPSNTQTRETRLVAPHPSSADLPSRGSENDRRPDRNIRHEGGGRSGDARNRGASKEPQTGATNKPTNTSQGNVTSNTSRVTAQQPSPHTSPNVGPPHRNQATKQTHTGNYSPSASNRSHRTHAMQQRTVAGTQPVKKSNFNARQKLPSGEPINNLSEQPRLQVVDMARYFNSKHGYQVPETAIVVHSGPTDHHHEGAKQQPSPKLDKRDALNLCDAHLKQLRRADLSPHGQSSHNDNRQLVPVGDISEQTRPRVATPVQIQLHQRDSPTSHIHPGNKKEIKPYVRRPIRKAANHHSRKNSLEMADDHIQSDSVDTWSNVSSRSQTPVITYLKRTGRPPSRSLYRTPVASMISSEGCIPNAVRKEDQHLAGDGSRDTSSSAPAMPPRPEWKRSQSLERKSRASSNPPSPRVHRAKQVRQPVPDRTMRVQSAKLKKHDDHLSPGHQNKIGRPIPNLRQEQVTSNDQQKKMQHKYAGYALDEKKTEDKDLGVLGEFSTRGLLGAILSRQPTGNKVHPMLQQNEPSSTPRKSESSTPRRTEAQLVPRGTPRQRYVHVPAFNFIDKNQLSSTKTKSVDVQRPPLVNLEGAKAVQVFDIQKSHDVASVDIPPRSVTPRHHGKKDVDWGRTYSLERKVSDTLKGGNDIARMRKTPEPVRYS